MRILLTILFLCSTSLAQMTLHTEDNLRGAKSMKAVISLGAVEMKLKGVDNSERAFKIFYDYSSSEKVPRLEYEVEGDEGHFRLSNDKGGDHFPFPGFGGNKDSLRLELANSVPLSLNMKFGVCDASIDLGGMEISDANFSTGVCSFKLDFSSPNRISCDNLSIKSGVSSVIVDNLSNARAREVEVKGGVGSVKIDFGGKLKADCSVRVKTGLGSLDVSIPSSINTVIMTPESFLTSVDVSGFYSQGGGVYRSSVKSGPELKIYIDSAMGGVSIRSY